MGRMNNVHHWGVKGKGRRDMNLDYYQRETVEIGAPLKIVKGTNKKRGCSETSV